MDSTRVVTPSYSDSLLFITCLHTSSRSHTSAPAPSRSSIEVESNHICFLSIQVLNYIKLFMVGIVSPDMFVIACLFDSSGSAYVLAVAVLQRLLQPKLRWFQRSTRMLLKSHTWRGRSDAPRSKVGTFLGSQSGAPSHTFTTSRPF